MHNTLANTQAVIANSARIPVCHIRAIYQIYTCAMLVLYMCYTCAMQEWLFATHVQFTTCYVLCLCYTCAMQELLCATPVQFTRSYVYMCTYRCCATSIFQWRNEYIILLLQNACFHSPHYYAFAYISILHPVLSQFWGRNDQHRPIGHAYRGRWVRWKFYGTQSLRFSKSFAHQLSILRSQVKMDQNQSTITNVARGEHSEGWASLANIVQTLLL